MQHDILNQQFFADLDSSTPSITEAETLPPECYTDPAFYEFEKEALFYSEWLCTGRVSWVKKPGQYFTTQIAGEPIIVVRTLSGELRAMSAVCQHRAMLVAEGHGEATSFLCPYHHWNYALDGQLKFAPAMEQAACFQKGEYGLPNFAVEVWQGFIFINMDPQAKPLAPRLTSVTEAVAEYDLENADGEMPGPAPKYDWNWKVMFENNNDGYHANKLHRGPLHDFVPSELATFPDLPADTAGYYRFNGTKHPDASFNATQKALLPIFPGLSEHGRERMVFANIPPTLSLVMTADAVIYLIVRATGPESIEMDTGVLVAPGASQSEGFDHKMHMNMAAAETIIAQDLHVDELVQVGLRSRYAVRGRYSWQEGAQLQFNQWLVPRYQACWANREQTNP